MITHDLLANLIAQNGLEPYAADLMKMSRSSIHISRTPVADDSKIPVGSSKFGGAPDVPAGFVWPHWQKKPLTFMAQIRLADVAPFDTDHLLPTTGWLHFFYDIADQPWGGPDQQGGWHVSYTADSAALTRLSPPEAALPVNVLSFGQSWTIPVLADDQPDNAYNLFAHGSDQIITVSADSIDDFDGLRNAVEAPTAPLHQLLGNPAQLQDDIRALSQYAANGVDVGAKDQDEKRLAQLANGIGDWRLLLQIDSDRDSFGTTWGDSGCLYVCITSAALAARQFGKAWLVFQSD
jgi:uncharacterized protein YwqG